MSWRAGGVPVSYLSVFFSELDHEIYCINKVILIIVRAAAVAQLVKASVSFAQHQGSIPTSLKFFFPTGCNDVERRDWPKRLRGSSLTQSDLGVLYDI